MKYTQKMLEIPLFKDLLQRLFSSVLKNVISGAPQSCFLDLEVFILSLCLLPEIMVDILGFGFGPDPLRTHASISLGIGICFGVSLPSLHEFSTVL